jgi:hypothetical protein
MLTLARIVCFLLRRIPLRFGHLQWRLTRMDTSRARNSSSSSSSSCACASGTSSAASSPSGPLL